MTPATINAPSVPGIFQGSGILAISAVKTIDNAINPGSGRLRISPRGRKLISTNAIAASEPSKLARGTVLRMKSVAGAQTIFSTPLITMHQIPMYQVR